jgi:hypothetical protein
MNVDDTAMTAAERKRHQDDAREDKQPRALPRSAQLGAPFQGVSVKISCHRWGFHFRYKGSPSDLVACGAVTEAQLRKRHPGVKRYDIDGDEMRIYRRRERVKVEVCRSKRHGEWKARMPGFEPWMLNFVKSETSISPEDWRNREAAGIRTHINLAIDSVLRFGDPPPFLLPLDSLFEPAAADLAAFEARALTMAAELVDMLENMRVLPATATKSRMRLVVNNTSR